MSQAFPQAVTISKTFASEIDTPSERAIETASMFGLDAGIKAELNLIPACSIPVPEGGIVFITGPSGGGKSTILKLLKDKLAQSRAITELKQNELTNFKVIDCFNHLPLDEALTLLGSVGLSDAHLMLRTSRYLSDGEKYRLNFAQTLASISDPHTVIFADEFCSTLDRITAVSVALNVRRWISKTKHTLVVASANDDLLESLKPDVLVFKDLGAKVKVISK